MKKGFKKGLIYGLGLALFLSLLIYFAINQGSKISELAMDPVAFKAYLNSFGSLSVLVFIGLQVCQVLVAPIPGEVIQLAGGFVFGTFKGAFYSVLGISLGGLATFYVARFLGTPVLKMFISDKTFQKYELMINSTRAEVIIFILFLIPGSPKDVLTYMAGITPVKPGRFIISTTVARFPGILMSAYIGANLQSKNMTVVIIATAVAVILFLLGVLYRDRLVAWASRQ